MALQRINRVMLRDVRSWRGEHEFTFDEDVTVLSVVADGHLRGDQTAASGILELVDQVHAVVVNAVDVTVDVDAVTVGPIVGLIDVHVVELPTNHGVIDLL